MLRVALAPLFALLFVSSTSGLALAQACHMPELGGSQAERVRVSGRAAFASYRNPVYAGEYQGYFATASYTHPWVHAEAQVAAYRLVRNGLAERGLGDTALDVRAALFRLGEELALGLELAATLPTGSAERSLGMGHVMMMPGAWLGFQRAGLRLLVQLAYGRMWGSGEPGHAGGHAATGPLVNPMNRSEVEHAVSLSYAPTTHLFAGGRLFGAVPIAANAGRAREIAALAVGVRFAPVEVGAELQLPLAGSPFVARTVLSLSASF